MVCRQCGREYEESADFCTFCRKQSEDSGIEVAATDSMVYESNLGFSRAESQFEASQVIVSLSKFNEFSSKMDKSAVRDAQQIGSQRNNSSGKVENQRQDMTYKTSKRMEKKLIKQRQLRLQLELKTRLQEEKLETLSQYMYQGLNQDIVEEAEEAKGNKKKDRSIKLSILGVVVVILLSMGILLYLGSMSEKTDYSFVEKDAIEVFTDQTSGKTYVFNSKGDMLYKLNGYLRGSYYTADHTAAMLYSADKNKCVYVNAYRMYEFPTTVYAFALSEDGNYVVYSVGGGLGKYYLYHYNVITDTNTLIDNQEKQFNMLNVLPGGNLITYITYEVAADSPLQSVQSYIIRNNGTPELVKDNVCVFAVSYDQSNLYYCEFDETGLGAIYVRNNKSDTLLSEGINNTIYFNKDYSQILIEDDGSYYISTQGGLRQKVTDGFINAILLPNKGTSSPREGLYINYGIQSFEQKLLLSNDNTLQILDEELIAKEIGLAADTINITLSKDGKNFFYIDADNRLVKVTDAMKQGKAEVWAEGVTEYKASPDLSKVYFLRDQDLYYKADKSEELLIGENVRDLSLNHTGDAIFFLQNYNAGKGTLYYSMNGAPAKAIEGGTNVTGVKEWNFGVIYQKFVNGSIAVFYNTEGKDFLFIMDGLNLLDDGNIALR